MQYRTWLSATFLAVLATSVWADGYATLKCDGLDANKPGEGYRAFQCIEAMDEDLKDAQKRIKTLEGQLAGLAALAARLDAVDAKLAASSRKFVPAVGDHSETKAIVAYYSAKGQKNCPKGWDLYEDAKDRFIFGSSPDGISPGRTGGAPEVTLKVEHMPAHDHATNTAGLMTRSGEVLQVGTTGAIGSVTMPYGYDFASGVNNTPSDHVIAHRGGSKPHTNMPPYIALYFCQRNGD